MPVADGYLSPDQVQLALMELEALRSSLGLPTGPLGAPQVSAAAMARAPTSRIGLANDDFGAGRDTGAYVTPYNPGFRDRIGGLIAGDNRDEIRGTVADVVAGTRGIGQTDPTYTLGPLSFRPSDLAVVGPAADFFDKSSRGEIVPAMFDGISAVSMGAPGVGARAMGEIGAGMGYLTRPVTDAVGAGLDATGRAITAAPRTAAAGLTGGFLGAGTSEAGEPPKAPAPSASATRTLFPDDPELSAMRERRAGMVSGGNQSFANDPELQRLRSVIAAREADIGRPADRRITTAMRNAWIEEKKAAEAAYSSRVATLEGNQRGDVQGLDQEIATRVSDLKRKHPTYAEAYPWLSDNQTAMQILGPIAAGLFVKGGSAAASRYASAPWRSALREGERAVAAGNLGDARIAHAGARAFSDASLPAPGYRGYLSRTASALAAPAAGISVGEGLAMAPETHNRFKAPPGSLEQEKAEAFFADPWQIGMRLGYGAGAGYLGGWTGGKLGAAANNYLPGSMAPVARTNALGARITAAEREATREAQRAGRAARREREAEPPPAPPPPEAPRHWEALERDPGGRWLPRNTD